MISYLGLASGEMNAIERARREARVALFTRQQGLTADVASRAANRLVTRDRESDERRLCIECRHLTRNWRRLSCDNYKIARAGIDLSSDLVVMLQRCPGFAMRRRQT